MRAALRQGDAETLRGHAHTLKGSSSSVGAVMIAGAAGELELLARAATSSPPRRG